MMEVSANSLLVLDDVSEAVLRQRGQRSEGYAVETARRSSWPEFLHPPLASIGDHKCREAVRCHFSAFVNPLFS